MLIEKKNTADLLPADYNPRKDLKPGDAEYEKLKRSIEQFGYVEPIIWNKTTGRVVGGHQRLKVLIDMGIDKVECVVIDMDEESEKALNIALNKISGEWDNDKLALLISDLQGADFDISLTGFDPAEIDDLFGNEDEAKEDDFDVDGELEKPCFSKDGDVWHLGKHCVICGDSTKADTYKKLLGDTKVNLVCTDPPYFVSLESKSGKIKNDDLDDKEGYIFLKEAFECLHDAMAKDASIYVFYATSKARVFHDAYEDAGFKVGAGLVWKKDRLVLTRTDWKYIHEPIIWGWRKDGKHIWYGDQKQKTVFEFDRIKNSKEDGCGHPSSKPVPLIAYLIKQCTVTNGIVLDAFLGSASTLIACEQLNRVCYGIELEPKFVDVAIMRFLKITNNEENVYVIRDEEKISYADVVKEMT
ncbi:MAG: DNA modification methylase [Clostridia bacterium]|nr:DNA modification methylase [Clostridia bacterium]